MNRKFINALPYLSDEVWSRLQYQRGAPDHLLGEVFRDISRALREPPSPGQLAGLLERENFAAEALADLHASDIASETAFVTALESCFETIEEFDVPQLPIRYAALIHAFIKRHNLRYRVRKPFQLIPTLEGIFDALVNELRSRGLKDPDLSHLIREFEEAFGDTRSPYQSSRVKICLSKQFNLAEGFLADRLGQQGGTLGKLAAQVKAWPHDAVRDALCSLYKFACDYPGIRHGGTPTSKLRDLGARDFVAVPILLIGVAAYAADDLDHSHIVEL